MSRLIVALRSRGSLSFFIGKKYLIVFRTP
jgi:hypothetical protein